MPDEKSKEGRIKMNTFIHHHIKLMMLFGLILVSGSWGEVAQASGTNWISANHQLVIHDAAAHVNGVYYLRNDRITNATIRPDFSGVDLSRFKQWYAEATLFRPGAHYFPSIGGTSFNNNMPVPHSINFGLQAGLDMCGERGDLGAEITLSPNFTTVTARTRLQVAIDCQAPIIRTIGGSALNRFNNTTIDTHGSYDLSIKMVDDTGIRSVEVASDNPALSISPHRLASDQIRRNGKSVHGYFFTAPFSMRATNTEPVNGVGITVRVTDMAGRQHADYHFSVNLAGDARHQFTVNLAPLRPVTVGQRTAFRGTLIKRSHIARGEHYMWQIIKVPTRTSTSTRSIVDNQFIRVSGRRTPFIIPFTPRHAGFYRFQFLDSHNGRVYISPALEVRPTFLRTPHTTKKVSPTPARRLSIPKLEKRF